MNRKIIVLLILIGIFAIIGIATYSRAIPKVDTDTVSEVGSEKSETSSEVEPVTSEIEIKSETEGVDTAIPSEAISDEQVKDTVTDELDENGDVRSESKYLDEDGDTIANYFDICPGVDDFSSECETDAYNVETKNKQTEPEADGEVADVVSDEVDDNGDVRSASKYLDDDGDTVANYYDICSGIDDFSNECAEA